MAIHYIYYFFLFESLSLGLAPLVTLFFKFLLFKRKKGMTSSMTQKNPKKWCFFYRDGFLYNNKRTYFKKRATRGASPKHELSNKKKYLASYCTGGEKRWRYSVENMFWEKTKKIFCFFKKMPVFRIEHAGNHQIF